MSIQKQQILVRRKRRWRRRLLLLLLFFVCLVGGGYAYIANPQRLGGLIAAGIARSTGAEVRIEGAYFDFDGLIRLEGLSMRVKDTRGILSEDAKKLLEVDRVEIHHDILTLLTGGMKYESFVFYNPQFYMTEVVGKANKHRAFNWRFLKSEGEALVIPKIQIVDGIVHGNKVIDGKLVHGGSVYIEGLLEESVDKKKGYRFEFRRRTTGGKIRSELRGHVNLQTKALRAVLTGFEITRADRAFLPSTFQKWFDRASPDVKMPRIELVYDPEKQVVRVVAEVVGKTMLLPLYGDERRVRFSDVRGRFVFHQALSGEGLAKVELANALRIEELEGVLGLGDSAKKIKLSGYIEGLNRVAPIFDMKLSMLKTGIPLTKARGGLPLFLRKILNQYEIESGDFDLAIHVRHLQEDEAIEMTGRVGLFDVVAGYKRFPGKVQKLNGQILFKPGQITIDHIGGEVVNGGGRVDVFGEINGVGQKQRIDLTVAGKGITLEAGYGSLNKRIREQIDVYRDGDQYRKLIDGGLIISPRLVVGLKKELAAKAKKRAGLLAALGDAGVVEIDREMDLIRSRLGLPVFALGGRLSFETRVKSGDKKRVRTRTVVRFDDVGILSRQWGYPLILGGGRMVITGRSLVFEGLKLRGVDLGGGKKRGRIGVDGEVLFTEQGVKPRVAIVAKDFVFGKLVKAAVVGNKKEEDQIWKKDLHLGGTLSAVGKIDVDQAGRVRYGVDVTLGDGRVNPYGKGYVVDGIGGVVRITRKGVELIGLKGGHGERTKFELDGKIGGGDFWIDLKAEGLALGDEKLLTVLPRGLKAGEELRQFFKGYQLRGDIDFDLRLGAMKGGGAVGVRRIQIKPSQLGMTYRGEKIFFDKIRGDVKLVGDELRLNDLELNWGSGKKANRMTMGGWVDLNRDKKSNRGLDVSLGIDAHGGDKGILAMIPESLHGVLKKIGYGGPFVLSKGRIKRGKDKGGKDVLEMTGRVTFRGARAHLGLPITEFKGYLDVEKLQISEGGIVSRMTLGGDRLRVSKHLMTELKLGLSSDGKSDKLWIKDIKGKMYGGKVWGKGHVGMSGDGSFELRLNAGGVSVGKIIEGAKQAKVKAKAKAVAEAAGVPHTGVLEARVFIAKVKGAQKNSGSGEINLSETNLFDSKMLSLVTFLGGHMNPKFDELRSTFIIKGPRFVFDRFEILSKSVALKAAGKAYVDYTNGKLWMNMSFVDVKGGDVIRPEAEGMFRLFSKMLVNVQVRGSIEKPEVRGKLLGGLFRTLGRIVGSGESKKVKNN